VAVHEAAVFDEAAVFNTAMLASLRHNCTELFHKSIVDLGVLSNGVSFMANCSSCTIPPWQLALGNSIGVLPVCGSE
jgi:hypothetical protein